MDTRIAVAAIILGMCALGTQAKSATVALWLFDEREEIYPSCVLGDDSANDYPLVLGRGGSIVEGKFGNALEPKEQAPLELSAKAKITGFEKLPNLGPLRKTPPMDWSNATFCALMTRGEQHLRQEVGFASPTNTRLNLGDFDWTVEFWLQRTKSTGGEGVILEIGQGPRGEKDHVTQLLLNGEDETFTFINEPSHTRVRIPSGSAGNGDASWHHYAFVYDDGASQLRLYVDGRVQSPPSNCKLKPLESGNEDYISIGRDGTWARPLGARIDELRISDEQVYRQDFSTPESFSVYNRAEYTPPKLQVGLPLLFASDKEAKQVIDLGGRKYVFIDDAIIAESEHLEFTVNPPHPAERVLDNVRGHLVVWEDPQGLIRLYHDVGDRHLGVLTSHDGVHWEKPAINAGDKDKSNVVIDEPVALGTILVDRNASENERIKFVGGYDGRGIYVYSSPDGFHFKRNRTAALPFRAASQSISYYDDQRQSYTAFHRTDMPRTDSGETQRSFVRTETTDLMRPWPFRPVSLAEHLEIAKQRPIGKLLPWYLDNGPLTPPGFGVEYPLAFGPEEGLDPVGTDIYVPKNVKYEWAPDTYLAFPIVYFHYDGDGPATRQALGKPERNRGSGTFETQLAVSRDGVHWKRYPRPAYIPMRRQDGFDIHKNYIAHGMVRRGDEIWQYYLGSEQYHSSFGKGGREAVFRVVQRLDGFVSADTPYTGGRLLTKPLTFDGNRLVLNIETGATGYAQVGLLDSDNRPFAGFGVDDCVYINADATEYQVEWLTKGADISSLAGKPIRVEVRSRGTKLYAMQFVKRS